MMALPPTSTARRRAVQGLAAAALLALAALPACAGGPKPIRPGDPAVSIPLESLGFEQPQPRLLTGGATMFTLHFVDATHVLLTFNSHGLIPRDSGGLPQDQDRLVKALLVELPSGKVLARTDWHTRDRQQYLWPLTHGMFLLRIQHRLTVLDPLGNLPAGNPFKQAKFLEMDRRIGLVSVSPGGDLLVIETIPPPKPEMDDPVAALAGGPNPNGPDPNPSPAALTLRAPDTSTQIHLFRLLFDPQSGAPTHLIAQSAGQLNSPGLIRIPATAEGFLEISKESSHTWLFDFHSHAGKHLELSPYDTTCVPTPYFISRSEFVAFGCHGSDTRVELSDFNLRGEEPWVDVLSGQHISPSLVSAPDAGRFAFSRVLLGSTVVDLENLLPEELTAQEIVVFQSHNGRALLKVQATPIQRTGQNFDLSPDGMNFAVIRNGNLDVFQLPALTKVDEERLKLAAASVPEKNDARIRLMPLRPDDAASAKSAGAPVTQTNALTVVQAAPVAPQPTRSATGASADAPPADEPRTPPTLYGPDHPKPPP